MVQAGGRRGHLGVLQLRPSGPAQVPRGVRLQRAARTGGESRSTGRVRGRRSEGESERAWVRCHDRDADRLLIVRPVDPSRGQRVPRRCRRTRSLRDRQGVRLAGRTRRWQGGAFQFGAWCGDLDRHSDAFLVLRGRTAWSLPPRSSTVLTTVPMSSAAGAAWRLGRHAIE